jgi:hypothetical protein
MAVRVNLDQPALAELSERLDRRVERIRTQTVGDEEVTTFDSDVRWAGRAVATGGRVRRQAIGDDFLDAVPQT